MPPSTVFQSRFVLFCFERKGKREYFLQRLILGFKSGLFSFEIHKSYCYKSIFY